jgi:MYXO-CTERM domain-containing protein
VSARRVSAGLAALVLGSACAAPPGEGVRASEAAIIGGAETTGDPAVVMLVGIPADHATFDACTASLVAPDVLLTAAHCVDPATHAGYSFGIFTGPDASAYPTANTLAPVLAPIAEVHVHPDYSASPPFHADIAVARLASKLDVPPLPVERAPLGADVVGAKARLVGYGQSVYGTYSAVKRAADTVVASLGDDTIVVGDQAHRSCVGDSGGPALVERSGTVRIVGVDSYTELKGCLEPANYRRTDTYAEFLAPYLPPEEGAGGSGGAGGSAAAGAGGAVSAGGSGAAGGGSTTSAPSAPSSDAPASSGGCAAAASPTSGGVGAMVAAAVALALARRRRR